MSTATQTRLDAAPQVAAGQSVFGVRRAPRYVVVGAALMVAFGLLFGLLALRADPAVGVLAVAQPVAAGQTITGADVSVVRVVPPDGVDLVAEAERSTVVGRTAVVPLAAGSLLSPAQVGPVAWPPVGQSVVGVPVAEGRMPAGVAPGVRVSVLVGSPAEVPEAPVEQSAPVVAVVVGVAPPTAAGVSTVSLLLGSVEAHGVAAAEQVVLVLESPGG